MVYLYAGLGVVMLAGIMAIFEMGLGLTGNSLLPSPQDPYLTNMGVKYEDKRWLGLLEDSDLSGTRLDLCDALKDIYRNKYKTFPWDESVTQGNGRWGRSCFMNRGVHRVIVRPPDPSYLGSKYSFYSCTLQGGNDRCAFEGS